MIYKADISVGALMLQESRIVARLLANSADTDTWTHAIETENVLQKRSVGYAVRQASLIRARLSLMDSIHWEMIMNGDKLIATQALMAAAVKHSRLLADFMDIALREFYRHLETTIPKNAWSDYLMGCAARDADMPVWSELTQNKLKLSAYQMLAQSGFLSDTRTLQLNRVDIEPQLRAYLEANNERRVLACLEVSQ